MKRGAYVKIVILAMIFVCLILMSIIIQIYNHTKKEDDKNTVSNQISVPTEQEPSTLYTDTSIKKVQTMSLLLATQEVINKYYDNIYSSNSSGLMEILDTEYIKQSKVNSSNVVSNLKINSPKLNFFSIDVYSKEISYDHEYKFWVYGKAYTDDYAQVYEQKFIVNLDLYNFTFKITPDGNITKDGFKQYMDSIIHTDTGDVMIPDGRITSIDGNDYNKFEIYNGTEATKKAIEHYAKYYYFLEKTDINSAYELLNDDYKNKRFGSIDNYISSKLMWKEINVDYVKKEFIGDKVQYIGIDKNGGYYIFIENSPMDYEILLDSYTIPLTETVEKYNSSNNTEKACMCIELVKEMINMKDYQSLYNTHLNKEFKQNNFPTMNQFTNYINSKFYNNNKFEYISYTISEDCFIINVNLKDADSDQPGDDNEFHFVVKLNSSLTDFEYSFEVN